MTLEFPRLDRAEHKDLPAFLVEMDTLLGLVERCLLELDNAADSPLVSVQLRSHLESVSTNASRLSLPRTEEIARESARLVDRLSTRQTHATTKVVDALFASTGLLRSLLEHLEAHGNEGSIDARRHLAELSALGQPAASQTVELRSFNLSNTDTLGESFGSLQEINEEFVAESRDHLDQVQALLDMFASSQVTNDRLDEIARAFHTMKGVASILRHRALEALTHAAESVVAGLREGQIKPRLSHGTTLYHVVDVARQMLSRIEEGARDADVVHAPLINMLSVMNEDRSDTIEDSTEPQLTALPPQPTTLSPAADTKKKK